MHIQYMQVYTLCMLGTIIGRKWTHVRVSETKGPNNGWSKCTECGPIKGGKSTIDVRLSTIFISIKNEKCQVTDIPITE